MSPEQARSARPGHRHPHRRLFARRDSLRAARRRASVRYPRLRAAGLEAILRTIREEAPPKPSTKVRLMGAIRGVRGETQRGAADAARRLKAISTGSPSKRWRKTARGATRQSESFAADLRRHLEHLPVLARPRSPGYVFTRFLRRHKPVWRQALPSSPSPSARCSRPRASVRAPARTRSTPAGADRAAHRRVPGRPVRGLQPVRGARQHGDGTRDPRPRRRASAPISPTNPTCRPR